MSRLIFKAEDVRRVVEHSLASKVQRPTAYIHEPVTAPSVILVHDQGVYLMSNGEPRDLVEGVQSFCAYAEGCHPKNDEEWWDTARELVGGDDFAETLPWAGEIKSLLENGAKKIVLNFGAKNISVRAA